MCLTFGNPSDPCCKQAPPVPATGRIFRYMVPLFVDDYEGLATAEWQFGTTGELASNYNCHCAYHHFITPSKQKTSVHEILAPVRWTIHGGDIDGQNLDSWVPVGDNQDRTLALTQGFLWTTGLGNSDTRQTRPAGWIGVRDKLLPKQSHGRFTKGIAHVVYYHLQVPRPCLLDIHHPTEYLEKNLDAIAPGVAKTQISGGLQYFGIHSSIHAIRHRLNGQPIKRLYFRDELGQPAAYQFRPKPTDKYEIDVWYKIGHDAQPIEQDVPGKGVAYLPLGLVSTGDRWREVWLQEFGNVDYSPRFNHAKQTYELTVGGHFGWTLRDGCNGPFPMETNDDWNASINAGSVVITPKVPDGSPWKVIALHFSQEIATAHFVVYDRLTGDKHDCIYRAGATEDLYRSTTVSTKYGTINHAQTGLFNQNGTTTFLLVSWSYSTGVVEHDVDNHAIISYGNAAEGRTDFDSNIPRSIPRSLTFTRINRTT